MHSGFFMENLTSDNLPIVPLSCPVRSVLLCGLEDAISKQGEVTMEVLVLASR